MEADAQHIDAADSDRFRHRAEVARGKISCMDRELSVPGMRLPVR
jgi:hypothetical protein